MSTTTFKLYGYRWVVLAGFMLAVAFNQLLWITFAPITGPAAAYYGVSDLSIGLLSMSFMIAYLFLALPASWVIDTYGFRTAVGIGVVLTGVFGLMRGLVAANYTLVLIAQIGIAIGQPFILNAVTKVAARWFPLNERATASGLGSLAVYVGILVGLALTPFLTLQVGIARLLMIYGVGAGIAGVVFLAVAREHPATPPGPPEQEERVLMLDGLKQIVRKRDFQWSLLIFFIGLGIFNSVTTWIEDIVRPRGFSITEAGIAGGLMILGGVIGALVLPGLSDRYRRRVPFIVIALAGAIPGLAGVTFASTLALLYLAAFVFGFFLLSSGPIGFQYGAEIGRPTPEGTSNGLLLLMGQISGIAFIIGMDSFKVPATGSMTPSLVALIVLMGVALLVATRLHESSLLAA
ncbi:MAG: transporter, family, protein 7 [Anaerolineales bacterium]|jgi:MFS family permease|nr:MFS transporter, FLVCR family, MFS- protein 7 [Anaerolineales bacterium]MBM2843217.1 transporter, family, protein 7 [Anaerolineales bacterium]